MKKTSLVALALCVGAPLMAQAPAVSFYGVLDTGVAHVSRALNYSDDFVTGTSPLIQKGVFTGATGMFNGGNSQTRVGVKGSADLGDGWSGIFTLESALNLPSGRISSATESLAENGGKSTAVNSAISGQLYNRGAFIGVSHKDFGTLTFGRQQALLLDIMPSYDANGLAQLFTPTGFVGSFAGGGVTENSRVDNAVKYRVKFAGAVTVSALYKVSGAKGPDATASGASNQVSVEFAQGPFGIFGAYQYLRNGITFGSNAAAAVAGTVTATVLDTDTVHVGAKYKIGPVQIVAQYQQIKFQDPSVGSGDANYYLSLNGAIPANGTVPALTRQYAFGQQISAYSVTSIGLNATKKQTLTSLGAGWDATSKLKLSASYYLVKLNDFSQPGTNPINAKGSMQTAYTSFFANYAWAKALDLYAGVMTVKASGNAVDDVTMGYILPGGDTRKNAITGAGLRVKF
jgi:general bacterial porin, GBP family